MERLGSGQRALCPLSGVRMRLSSESPDAVHSVHCTLFLYVLRSILLARSSIDLLATLTLSNRQSRSLLNHIRLSSAHQPSLLTVT